MSINLLFIYSLVDTEGLESESLIVSAGDMEGDKDEEEEELDTTLINNTRTDYSVSVANGNNAFYAEGESTTQAYTNPQSITDHV